VSALFHPENRFWRGVDRAADVLILSLLWSVCSVPLVTIGAASTALYDAVAHCVRGSERTPYSRFFRTFKAEFKTATLSWLLWGGILLALLAGHFALVRSAEGAEIPLALAMACLVLAAVVGGVLCWLFPLLSRFEYTLGGLARTAVQFWFTHLPSTIAMTALLALCADLVLQLVFPLSVLPCLLALAHSFFVERAFRKHMPDQAPQDDLTQSE